MSLQSFTARFVVSANYVIAGFVLLDICLGGTMQDLLLGLHELYFWDTVGNALYSFCHIIGIRGGKGNFANKTL